MASRRHKNRIEIVFNAEDHRWYDKPPPGKEESEADKGVKPDSKAPPSFEPNYEKLVEAGGEDFIKAFGRLVRDLDQSSLRITMKLLHDAISMANRKFKLGQPVYWRAAPEKSKPYLDQWFRCFVIGIDQNDPKKLHITGRLKNEIDSSLITVPESSLKSSDEFKTLASRMTKRNHLTTPKGERRSVLSWKTPPRDELDDIAREVPFLRDIIKATRVANKQVRDKGPKPVVKSGSRKTLVTAVKQGGK